MGKYATKPHQKRGKKGVVVFLAVILILLAVVVAAMTTRKVPARAANTVLAGGIVLNALGYFVKPFSDWAAYIGQFHFVAIVFVLMLLAMVIWGRIAPRSTPYEEYDAKVIDLTPWKFARVAAVILLIVIALIYAAFADFGVFKKGKVAYPSCTVKTVQAAK